MDKGFKNQRAAFSAKMMVEHITKELGEVSDGKRNQLFLQWYEYFTQKYSEQRGFSPDLQK